MLVNKITFASKYWPFNSDAVSLAFLLRPKQNNSGIVRNCFSPFYMTLLQNNNIQSTESSRGKIQMKNGTALLSFVFKLRITRLLDTFGKSTRNYCQIAGSGEIRTATGGKRTSECAYASRRATRDNRVQKIKTMCHKSIHHFINKRKWKKFDYRCPLKQTWTKYLQSRYWLMTSS